MEHLFAKATRYSIWRTNILFALLLSVMFFSIQHAYSVEILNVSYDPTREFYKEYDKLFAEYWQKTAHEDIEIKTLHGASGKQARSVIDGLKADVVTLALSVDIDALNKFKPLLNTTWRDEFPNHSTPYTSTVVFLVRKGNPKHIHDWDDLIKEGVSVITSNPKTSGGARWAFLAAWAYAKNKSAGSDEQALAFVTELYRHVPILDTGVRGATISFIQRNQGDVLLTWENEAYLAQAEGKDEGLEVVIPSMSILTEPPVAVVDKVVDEKGTRKQAEAYINYLYSDEAQHLVAKHYYRPERADILEQYSQRFPKLTLIKAEDYFGSWQTIQQRFFQNGGVFDEVQATINQ